jgi:DNA modification methylase
MTIEKKPIEDLLPADYNPRKDLKPDDAEYEKLERSIRQFGYVEPVIWNKATGSIVGGHQRIKILKELGLTELDCVVVDFSLEQEKALNIALNKISGDWDKEKLALLIADLQGEDFDISLTGFDPAEIDDLFKDSLKDGIHDDEFDVDDELQKPALTQLGDVWHLGNHRLVCGDSTDPETFELLMAGRKANLVVTDPPYNVNYEGQAGKIKNDHMAGDAFLTFLRTAFENTEAHMADDASIYVFHADTEGLNFRKAFSDAGFYLSGTCIWKKQSLVLGRSPYQWQHEPVLFGWKKKGKHQWYTGRKESTIWEFDKPKKNADHPTMKPVGLLTYPIMNSSMSNTLILDPFGGSGSTLIACEQTERSCCTIELDEKYCDVIIKRYIELTGSADTVTVQRDGLTYRYDELAAKEISSEIIEDET